MIGGHAVLTRDRMGLRHHFSQDRSLFTELRLERAGAGSDAATHPVNSFLLFSVTVIISARRGSKAYYYVRAAHFARRQPALAVGVVFTGMMQHKEKRNDRTAMARVCPAVHAYLPEQLHPSTKAFPAAALER
jgi:hypothetical protein